MNIKIVHKPEDATGLAVIIDVFRAFTVEPYIINNNAQKLIPVGDKEIAYKMKEQNPKYILIGERKGIKLPGFDYGNSPSEIKDVDFTNKTVVHTTSCGTQGIIRAKNAKEILTGSFVNCDAIKRYITENDIQEISLVSMAKPNEEPAKEDQLFAEYMKSVLEGNPLINIQEKLSDLRYTAGARFFNPEFKNIFPEEDFYLCTELNKFDFVLKVNKGIDSVLEVRKIDFKKI